MTIDNFSRRGFLHTAAFAAAASSIAGAGTAFAAPLAAIEVENDSLKGRLWKTLKIGMVKVPGTLTEKFQAVKEAGFDGIEMNAPGMDVDETRMAIAESGLPVDGTVNSTHWAVRHTDPDAAIRAQALESLQSALRNTHAVGGHSAAGCWQRRRRS